MIELEKPPELRFSRDGASARSQATMEPDHPGRRGVRHHRVERAAESTLVRTINLLQALTAGDIVIDGTSIVGKPEPACAKRAAASA